MCSLDLCSQELISASPDAVSLDQRKWFSIGQMLPHNAINKQQLLRTAAGVNDQIMTCQQGTLSSWWKVTV